MFHIMQYFLCPLNLETVMKIEELWLMPRPYPSCEREGLNRMDDIWISGKGTAKIQLLSNASIAHKRSK